MILNFIAKAAEAKKAEAAAKKEVPAPVEKKEAPAPAPAPKPEPAPEPAPAPAPKPEPVVEAKKEEGEKILCMSVSWVSLLCVVSHAFYFLTINKQLLHHLRHQFQPQQLLNQQRPHLDLLRA